MSSYLPEPVGIRDWDVVNAVVPAAAVPVEDGGEVWKVAVEVKVLGISPTIGPTVQQVTLKHVGSNDWEHQKVSEQVKLCRLMMVRTLR